MKRVNEIEWSNWQAQVRATLLFVIKEGQVLLIHKKRGLGQGKVNGPGGKIEAGETPLECALRETEEEVCVRATGVSPAGELHFQFTDGLSIHGYVFRAEDADGVPQETEEADPFWCALDEIPYEQMWEDDVTWFDALIERRFFRGYYIFEGDRMLDARVDLDK